MWVEEVAGGMRLEGTVHPGEAYLVGASFQVEVVGSQGAACCRGHVISHNNRYKNDQLTLEGIQAWGKGAWEVHPGMHEGELQA